MKRFLSLSLLLAVIFSLSALFIPASAASPSENVVSAVGFQQRAGSAGTVDLRVVGTLNRENFSDYDAVGFEVTVVNESTKKTVISQKRFETGTVWPGIRADGTVQTAAQLGGAYVFAVQVTGLSAGGDFSVRVSAFARKGTKSVFDQAGEFTERLLTGQLERFTQVIAMTYNVKYKNFSSRKADQTAIKTLIHDRLPDVMGINEGTSDVISFLNASGTLPSGYVMKQGSVSNSVLDNFQSGFYNIILYNGDKYDCVASGTKWLTATPDTKSVYDGGKTQIDGKSYAVKSQQYRTASYVVLKEKATGAEFVFASTHLENNFDSGNPDNKISRMVRSAQAGYLVSIMNNLSAAYGNIPVIFGGDFNSNPTMPGATEIVTGTDYVSTHNNATVVVQNVSTEKNSTCVNGNTLASLWSTMRYDYLFIDRAVRADYFEAIDNIKSDGTYPSDHLPVYVKLSVPYRPSGSK